MRFDLISGYRRREGNRPLELANKPLGTVHLGILVFAFGLPLTGNAQRSVMQRDLDFLTFHPWQLGFDDQVVRDVDGGLDLNAGLTGGLVLDTDGIGKGDGLENGAKLMVAVASFVEHAEVEIDFG